MLELEDDYLVFDNLEPITIRRRLSSESARGPDGKISFRTEEFAVANCLHREMTDRVVRSFDGKARKGDVFWELPVAELPSGYIPKVGDVIIRATCEEFEILGVDTSTLKSRKRCHCRGLLDDGKPSS